MNITYSSIFDKVYFVVDIYCLQMRTEFCRAYSKVGLPFRCSSAPTHPPTHSTTQHQTTHPPNHRSTEPPNHPLTKHVKFSVTHPGYTTYSIPLCSRLSMRHLILFAPAVPQDANVGTTRQSEFTIKDLVVDLGESACPRAWRSKADDHKRKKKSDPLSPRPIQPAAARETRGMPGRGRGLTCAEAQATEGIPDERQHPPHPVDAQRIESISTRRHSRGKRAVLR